MKNHVIREHLFAESENGNDGIRHDEGGRGLAAQGQENEARQDADQAATRGQAARLERTPPRAL